MNPKDEILNINLIRQEYPSFTPKKEREEFSKFSIITPISNLKKLADFTPIKTTQTRNQN